MIRVLRSYEDRLERKYQANDWVVVATTPPARTGKVLRRTGGELAIVRYEGGLSVLDRVPVEAVDFVCTYRQDATALMSLIELLDTRRKRWNLDDLVNAARCSGEMHT